MSAASSYAFAPTSQSVCQTGAFIGSRATQGSCRDDGAQEGFANDLLTCMQVPLVPVYSVTTISTQVTSVTQVESGYAIPVAQGGTSSDSLMQLLQGLEAEIAQLAGGIGQSAGASQATGTCAASGTSQTSGTSQGNGLQGDYQTLYNEATAAVQDGSAFDVTLPSGETLSGKFSWGELEPAGDDALFTPGDSSAPDAGKQAFDNTIEQFLSLAQSAAGGSSADGQIANYNTTTSFSSDGTAISWSGSFSLAPADAIPKNSANS